MGDNINQQKHIIVDMGNSKNVKVGGKLSSRLVLNVTDENGNQKKGFFTQNVFNEETNIFVNSVSQLTLPKGYEKFYAIHDAIMASGEGVYGFFEILSKHGLSSLKDDDDREMAADAMPEIIDEFNKRYGTNISFSQNDLNNPKVKEYLVDICASALSAKYMQTAHLEFHKQSENINLNRRNNAMYDYAELLGVPELIAKSYDMTLLNGDKVMHGTFMDNAEGFSLADFNSSNELLFTKDKKPKKLAYTANTVKQLNRLQILDFLCANVDRHMGNVIFKTDSTSPDTVSITGIQGIDNDASFGVFDESNAVSNKETSNTAQKMSLLDDIKVIDKDFAEKILSLTKGQMEAKVRLAGLSQDEIRAAGERLQMLQERIIASMPNPQEAAQKYSHITGGKVPETSPDKKLSIIDNQAGWEKIKEELPTSKSEVKTEKNIFGFFTSVINTYENDIAESKSEQIFDDAIVVPKTDIPTGKTVSTSDNFRIDEQLERFNYLKKEYEANLGNNAPDENFSEVSKKLNDVIDTMTSIQTEMNSKASQKTEIDKFDFIDDMLSDKQRNLLMEKMKELGKAAGDYAANSENKINSPAANAALHTAKNLKAYTNFARESIAKDAVEAEKKIAVNLAVKTLEAETYKELSNRVKSISGSSKSQFKDMMRAFKQYGTVKDTLTNKLKARFCDILMDTAEKYLLHKVPQSIETGLKPKEKERVRFARDLIAFARKTKARAEFIEKKPEYIKSTAEFEKKYHKLAEQLKSAYNIVKQGVPNGGNPSEKYVNAIQVMANSMNEAKNFGKEYKELLNSGEDNSFDRDLRYAFGKAVKNGGSEYMSAYADCYNFFATQKKNIAGVYKTLGLDQKAMQNEKMLSDSYTASEKAKMQKKYNIDNLPQM